MRPGEVGVAIAALRRREFLLIAVDGLAGSGKSTVANNLDDVHGEHPTIISADEFYEPEQRDWRSWTAREGYQRYFDHTRLETDLLQPLRHGNTARYSPFDWSVRAPGALREIRPHGVVVVEGVYLLKPQLRHYWDASVWVETPRDLRERRLRARGESEPGWIEQWMLAEDYYLHLDEPAKAATWIVVGAPHTGSR